MRRAESRYFTGLGGHRQLPVAIEQVQTREDFIASLETHQHVSQKGKRKMVIHRRVVYTSEIYYRTVSTVFLGNQKQG